MQSLPSYIEIKNQWSLSDSQAFFIEQSRQTIRSILNGTDPRLLVIVGPCSIHDPLSAKEFACRLKQLSLSLSSQFFLVMRMYHEKPRTVSGWKGFLYDPLLNGSHQMQAGIERTRQLLLEMASLQIPTATEFLDPLTAYYYDDLIAWGSIGARTSSSQIHRQLASDLSMPIGFKNGIAGNISAAVQGAHAASHSHTFMRLCENGKPVLFCTKGNLDTHIILRGGESGPNYDSESISHSLTLLEQINLPARLLIDCSHHNSGKQADRQPAVFQAVINHILEGHTAIRGLMLESHLQAGCQALPLDLSQLRYGISITDACIDWQTTENLLEWGAHQMQQNFSYQVSNSCIF